MIDDFKQPGLGSLPKQNTKKLPFTEDTSQVATLPVPPIALARPERRKLQLWPFHWSKKKQIILGVFLALLLTSGAGAGYYWYKQTHKPVVYQAPVVKVEEKKEPPKPLTEAAGLTGVQVAPELAKRSVTGVMIENSPEARPQAGLKDAGVVFEAVAEGGITRFLALYQESQPDYIGPVRSARPYYLDWLLPFDAAYGHVGGSPEALANIKALGVKDMDQFANSGAYQRVNTRYAPHNVYTSTAKLDALKQQKGYTASTFTGFLRKPEAPAAALTAKSIDLTISSFLYNVHYDYDLASNSYLRSEGGKPHMDEKSASQLNPKVVIALVTPKGIATDRLHTTYGTVGSGQMFVFQDGVMTTGNWAKPDRKAQFTFTDAAGAPLKLNPGQTWLTMTAKPTDVSAKP